MQVHLKVSLVLGIFSSYFKEMVKIFFEETGQYSVRLQNEHTKMNLTPKCMWLSKWKTLH